jgi:muconolactone D-isomerase
MAELLEFLVTTELRPVIGVPPDELARLYREERERGFDLVRSGAIRQIWRIPGAPYRTVSIRVAPTVAQLQEDLESLPLFDWLKIEVSPLGEHPLMQAAPPA